MKRIFNSVITTVILIVVWGGFIQLNHQNTIFADTRAHCCESGQCHKEQCFTDSSILDVYDNCESGYISDCFRCLDLYINDLLCNPRVPDPYYCLDDTTKYYGVSWK